MTAYNVVRFRTKPGQEEAFLEAHRNADFKVEGFRKGGIIQTGDHSFCFVGEWEDMDALAAARPTMIGMLNTFREHLQDLGEGMGLTDPASGPLVVDINA